MTVQTGCFVPIHQLAPALGRPLRIALLQRRSKYDEDTKSFDVQQDAQIRFLKTLPPGSYKCDLRPAEEGGDVYRQVVSGWAGKGKHRLLRRIMADLSDYDCVLVHRVDRFARRADVAMATVREMREEGVRLYCLDLNLDTADPTNDIVFGIMSLLAQQFSDLSSVRIREHKARAKQLGGWRGGAVTYGFQVAMCAGPDGDLVPVRDVHGYKTLEHDLDERDYLLNAIDRIVDHGWSVAAVVRWLNEEGVPSPRGKRRGPGKTSERIYWTSTGLRRILQNPMLCGFDVVGVGPDRFQILEVDGRRHRPHPPIVSDERWHQLQRCLTPTVGERRSAQEPLLAGLVSCQGSRADGSTCGRRMYGPGRLTSNSASYACRSSNNLPADHPERCTGNAISAKHLHRLVEAAVQGIASDPGWQEALREAYAQARAVAAAEETDIGAELIELSRRMADLRRERESARSQARRAEVARDIDALDARIAELEELRSVPAGVATAEVDFVSRWESMDTAQRRALISDMVEGIEVSPSAGRGRGFDPSRVRVHLRHVGTLHVTEPVSVEQPRGCPECGQVFGSPMALGVHRRHKHKVVGQSSRRGPGPLEYVCPEEGCGRRTTSAGGLKRHVTFAHGQGAGVVVCPYECPRVFRTASDLGSHVAQVHRKGTPGPSGPVTCPDCGKVLSSERGLVVHRGRLHPAA